MTDSCQTRAGAVNRPQPVPTAMQWSSPAAGCEKKNRRQRRAILGTRIRHHVVGYSPPPTTTHTSPPRQRRNPRAKASKKKSAPAAGHYEQSSKGTQEQRHPRHPQALELLSPAAMQQRERKTPQRLVSPCRTNAGAVTERHRLPTATPGFSPAARCAKNSGACGGLFEQRRQHKIHRPLIVSQTRSHLFSSPSAVSPPPLTPIKSVGFGRKRANQLLRTLHGYAPTKPPSRTRHILRALEMCLMDCRTVIFRFERE